MDERERACDQAVLLIVAEPRTYAEGILNVCKRYVEAQLACVAGVSGSDLRKRIGAIMRNEKPEVLGLPKTSGVSERTPECFVKLLTALSVRGKAVREVVGEARSARRRSQAPIG